MEYEGRLYGKIGRKYVPLENTTDDFKKLEKIIEDQNMKIGELTEKLSLQLVKKPLEFDPCFGTCEIVGCDEKATAVDLMEHHYCDSCAEQNKEEEPENWYDDEDEEMEDFNE